MTLIKFNKGDRVVRIEGHEIHHVNVGEFATVVDDSEIMSRTGVVNILFDNMNIFGGKVFKSYRCNLRLVEKSDLFDVDE